MTKVGNKTWISVYLKIQASQYKEQTLIHIGVSLGAYCKILEHLNRV